MAVSETIAQEAGSLDNQAARRGSFVDRGIVTIFLSEVLFFICRAAAHHTTSIDEIVYWLAGLTPFILQLAGQRFFSWRSTTYIQIWVISLCTFLAIQFSGLAHLIEYPLNLRVDVGFLRNVLTSGVYVLISSSVLLTIRMVSSKRGITDLAKPAFSMVLVCLTFALLVLEPY